MNPQWLYAAFSLWFLKRANWEDAKIIMAIIAGYSKRYGTWEQEFGTVLQLAIFYIFYKISKELKEKKWNINKILLFLLQIVVD